MGRYSKFRGSVPFKIVVNIVIGILQGGDSADARQDEIPEIVVFFAPRTYVPTMPVES